MTDYISRADAIEAVQNVKRTDNWQGAVIALLSALPSADVVSREFYEDAVKANIGIVIENRKLKAQIESADAVPFDVQLQSTRDAIDRFAKDRVKVVRCKDCRHAYFKDFDKYCRRMVGALKPNQYCSYGERNEKVECSECRHKDTCEDAYMEHSQYCNGERAEQTEKGGDAEMKPIQNGTGYTQQSRPHGRLIDADALLDEWLKQKDPTFKCGEMETFFEDMCSKWIDMLHDAPTINIPLPHYVVLGEDSTVEPIGRPHGEWLDVDNEPYCECSVCGSYIDNLDDGYAFCPRCGADMRGGEDDE